MSGISNIHTVIIVNLAYKKFELPISPTLHAGGKIRTYKNTNDYVKTTKFIENY